jgi:hypothetical protein
VPTRNSAIATYGSGHLEGFAVIRSVGKGEGGFAEDHEYFGELASI